MKRAVALALLLPVLAAAAGPAVFADGFKGTENLAFDGRGALYVSDAQKFCKVEGGKSVELYRLQKGEGASLGGVAIGPGGRVYFSVGATIKTYDPATGKIEDFVSGFKFANGICFDDAGNLFVADTNGRAIWVIPAGSHQKKPLKENAGLVNGIIWNREFQAIAYTVMLPGEFCIMGVSPKLTGGVEMSVKKFPGAILDDLTLDAAGNAYVCLYGGGKVVKIAPDGKEETVLSGLDGPSAAEFGPDGRLYVTIKGKTLSFNGTTVVALDLAAPVYRQPFLP